MKASLTTSGSGKIRHSGVFWLDPVYGNDLTGRIDDPSKPFNSFIGIANYINNNPLNVNANGLGNVYYDVTIKINNPTQNSLFIDTGLINSSIIENLYSFVIENEVGSTMSLNIYLRNLPAVTIIKGEPLYYLNVYWIYNENFNTISNYYINTPSQKVELHVNVKQLTNYYEQISINTSSNLQIRSVKKEISSFISYLNFIASNFPYLNFDNFFISCNIDFEYIQRDSLSGRTYDLMNFYKNCNLGLTSSNYRWDDSIDQFSGKITDEFKNCFIGFSLRNYVFSNSFFNNANDIVRYLTNSDITISVYISEKYVNCNTSDRYNGIIPLLQYYGVANLFIVENSSIKIQPKIIINEKLDIINSKVITCLAGYFGDLLSFLTVDVRNINLFNSIFANGNSMLEEDATVNSIMFINDNGNLYKTVNVENCIFNNYYFYINAVTFDNNINVKFSQNVFNNTNPIWVHSYLPIFSIGLFKIDSLYNPFSFPDLTIFLVNGVINNFLSFVLNLNNLIIEKCSFYTSFNTSINDGYLIKFNFQDPSNPTSVTGKFKFLSNLVELIQSTTNNLLIEAEINPIVGKVPVYKSGNIYRNNLWTYNKVRLYGEDRDVYNAVPSSPYTLDKDDRLIVNGINSAVIILPLLSNVIDGKIYEVFNNTMTPITINTSGSDLINGVSGSIVISPNSVMKFKALKDNNTYITI